MHSLLVAVVAAVAMAAVAAVAVRCNHAQASRSHQVMLSP